MCWNSTGVILHTVHLRIDDLLLAFQSVYCGLRVKCCRFVAVARSSFPSFYNWRVKSAAFSLFSVLCSTLLLLPPRTIPLCRWMLGWNTGQMWLRHWLSDALATHPQGVTWLLFQLNSFHSESGGGDPLLKYFWKAPFVWFRTRTRKIIRRIINTELSVFQFVKNYM